MKHENPRNLLNKTIASIQKDTPLPEKVEEVNIDTFNKAVEDEGLETYTEQSLNAYFAELKKGIESESIEKADIEKAKKNIAKLQKKVVIGKDGKRHVVWVKPGEDVGVGKTKTKKKEDDSHKKYASDKGAAKDILSEKISRARKAYDKYKEEGNTKKMNDAKAALDGYKVDWEKMKKDNKKRIGNKK